MDGFEGEKGSINSFALVSYLSGPLAAFLDRLRCELVPKCRAKAHVTVLPPRPIHGPSDQAWEQVRNNLHDFEPFRVELGSVEVFPMTQVIYLSLLAGRRELERIHSALNVDAVRYEEPFTYHPHITLAQELTPAEHASALELCEREWRKFSHSRTFSVDKLTFVQNTLDDRWIDLAGHALTSRVTL